MSLNWIFFAIHRDGILKRVTNFNFNIQNQGTSKELECSEKSLTRKFFSFSPDFIMTFQIFYILSHHFTQFYFIFANVVCLISLWQFKVICVHTFFHYWCYRVYMPKDGKATEIKYEWPLFEGIFFLSMVL